MAIPSARRQRRASPALRLIGALLAMGVAVPAAAAEFPLAAGQTLVGRVQIYVTRAQETLLDVARRYDLGYIQLVAANRGIDPWLPGNGRRIVVPGLYLLPDAPRRGIVINLAERRLFYYPPGGRSVETFPVGVAVPEFKTPLGRTRVVAKLTQPIWYPPASIRRERPDLPLAVPPGPDNPLGAYALMLGWRGYLIHGTNKPDGVGRAVSHGCLHLYPEDIARLYRDVPIGTPVRVVNEAAETQWSGDTLLVDVHPGNALEDEPEAGDNVTVAERADLAARIDAAATHRRDHVDWAAVERAVQQRTGIPVPVTRPPGSPAAGSGLSG